MKKLGLIMMLVLVTIQAANAMIPGPALRVECPKCGAEKRLMTIISGNTFGATQWSDTYMDAPMLPRLSPVQKCLECGHYYLLDKAKEQMEERDEPPYATDLGRLTYPEMKEALCMLEKDSLSKEDEITLRIEFLHRYNDAYREGDDISDEDNVLAGLIRTEDDRQLFQANNKTLIGLLDEKYYTLLKAELYRESCEFEKCIKLLKEYDTYDKYEMSVIEKMMSKAHNVDDRVFRLDEE